MNEHLSELFKHIDQESGNLINTNNGDIGDPTVPNPEICPQCHTGKPVIDGCLNLSCPVCGFTQTGGGFT
jgi:hypothetical protein